MTGINKVILIGNLGADPEVKDRYEVISGNHRVKAAKMAGVSQIHILVEHGLTLAEKRAKQISQNTLVGKDDEQILRELLSDISDAEEKRYAFVNEEYLKSVTDFDYDIVQPTHEIVNYNLTFFEPDERYFKQVCEQVEEATSAEEETILLPKPAMEKFLEISGEISTKYKIKSLAIALLKMAELSQLAIENELDQNGKE